MITITDPRIDDYLLKLNADNDPDLVAMERRAAETGFPIVGRQVGRLLYLLTRLRQPRLVVELGSGFGYSAWWFARAIGITGRVVMTEHAGTNIDFARAMFQANGLFDRLEFRVGDALAIGNDYRDIDILFIDLDKHQYREAAEAMIPRLARNALVIADNALWHGRVAEGDDDPETRGIRDFNAYMAGRLDFFSTIVPVRDGVMLAYKFD